MKIYAFSILAFALLSFVACKPQASGDTASDVTTTAGTGESYTIDAARSEVRWEGSKPTGTHTGLVPVAAGNVLIHEGMITGGSVTLDMANLTVTDLEGEYKANLEAHLKGTNPGKEEDFFNVSKFPTATFTVNGSSKLENDPEGTHMIQGDLTIKGVTKQVSFKANVDMAAGNAVKVTTAPFSIDRTEWGIKFQSKKFFDDLKDDFINDDVKVQITLGAIKQG